jgi:L-threonylcarbamoyladenylate synthase
MQTLVLAIDPDNPEKEKIKEAASVIRKGGLVAFPTETVYGLGANAFDPKAVKKIFIAKGRPYDNPMIVHIANKADIFKVASEIPPRAKLLMAKYWPGPLTIVLKKSSMIPKEVTAGLETVAVRMPSNKIALELIAASGLPIAAPSANKSGSPSTTSAGHVIEDLNSKVDIIIDGGETEIGLESTVVDMTGKTPMLLRPGKISLEELKKLLGKVTVHSSVTKKTTKITAKAPGMKYRHYSPKTDLILVEKGNVHAIIEKYSKKKKKAALITINKKHCNAAHITVYFKTVESMAKHLFATLRDVDKKCDVIIVEGVKDKDLGLAVMNRLRKAASKVIK